MGPGDTTTAGALTWARGFHRPSPIWAVSSLSPRGCHPSVISHRLFSLEKGVVLSAGWWLAGLLLCWRFLGPFVVSDFSRGGQVAGSPAPFYLTRQQADHNHQQQGGSSFSWLRVVQNRRPWASSVFPSTPLYRRGFIIVVTPMWVYSFVRNGHGVGGMQQLFTLFVVQETTTTSDGASMHACISSRRFQASLYA